jgi:aryl-alcohol dehydrogenase-like predicted oxidoreductase
MAVKDDYFDCYMVGLNFVNQSVLRHIIPEAKKKNIGIQSIYAVRGRLSTFEKAKELIEECIKAGEVDAKDIDNRDDPLRFLITEGGATSLPNACYRFNRYSFGQDVVLTGTGSVDHLKENVKSINDPPLAPSAVAKLQKIFGRVETATAD